MRSEERRNKLDRLVSTEIQGPGGHMSIDTGTRERYETVHIHVNRKGAWGGESVLLVALPTVPPAALRAVLALLALLLREVHLLDLRVEVRLRGTDTSLSATVQSAGA